MKPEIKKIYKVKEREFNTEAEAQTYINNDLESDEIRKKLKQKERYISNGIDLIIPFFQGSKSYDYLYDTDINTLRQQLYDFMNLRRSLLGVNEYKKKEGLLGRIK